MIPCLPNIRVLDLSRVFAGPWAAQMLGDLGADVLKVEHPATGDDNRAMGFARVDPEGRVTGQTSSFIAMNRNKRSVAIDLADPVGRARLLALADRADVLIENFKVGTMARRGLDYPALAARNPRLIYCSISGFGQDGPYASRPSYDAVAQAMSGLMSITGHAGQGPALTGYSVSDINAGFYAAIAILGALHHRDTVSGRGQHIDLSLLDAQVAAQSHVVTNYLISGRIPVQAGSASQINTPWQSFETATGSVMLTIGNDGQFATLCRILGLHGYAEDPRFASNRLRFEHRDALLPALEQAFRTDSAANWLDRLGRAGVPVAPINDFRQALDDPQVRHRAMIRTMPDADGPDATDTVPIVANPIRYSETPITYRRPPPRLGEHAAAVLAEWLGGAVTGETV